jgi:hypothetical protein
MLALVVLDQPQPPVNVVTRSMPAAFTKVGSSVGDGHTLASQSLDLPLARRRPLGKRDSATGRDHPVPRQSGAGRQRGQHMTDESRPPRLPGPLRHRSVSRYPPAGDLRHDRQDRRSDFAAYRVCRSDHWAGMLGLASRPGKPKLRATPAVDPAE